MQPLFSVFYQNILPIFIVAAMGFMLRRYAAIDKRVVSRLAFFVFSPCLLFSSLVNSTISPVLLGRLMLFATLAILGIGAVAYFVGHLLRLQRKERIMLMLAAMFGNAGNFGLPLNTLRNGETGLAHAIPYFLMSSILIYTVGVVLASLGKQGWWAAILGLLRLPIFYAIVTALPVYLLSIPLPPPLNSAITIAGEGAIPVMLILLGMQMADIRSLDEVRLALPASLLRLIGGPLLGVLLALLLGLSGVSRAASILQASVPVAVATIIVTTEYDLLPKAMTTTVVLSTLLAPLTLVAVIGLFNL